MPGKIHIQLLLKFAYQPYKWIIALPLSVLATLIGGVICIITVLIFDEDAADAVAVFWARFCCAIVPIHLNVIGKHNYKTGQSYVIVSNHQSMADIPVLHAGLGIEIKWIMKKELARIPVFGRACDKLGCIFIDRFNRTAAIEAMEAAKKKLSKNASVVFFAEGTRSRDGKVLPFKKGAFRFALDCGLPILPVTIKDSNKILPPDSLDLFPGTITVIIHPPIDVTLENHQTLDAIISQTHHTISRPIHS